MNIEDLKIDISKRNKKGISFILASVIIWSVVLVIWTLPISDVLTRNLLTFCSTAPLMPLAYGISKLIKVEFDAKDNALNKLGLLFSLNQLMYILIAMWVYNAVPDKMVMVIAIIFGAHLLPFGWLYKSKAYTIMSVVISLSTLLIGVMFTPIHVATSMVIFEVIFSIWLVIENKQNLT